MVLWLKRKIRATRRLSAAPALLLAAGFAILVAGCGGSSSGAAAAQAQRSAGDFPVRVTATFPAHQRLGEPTSFTVRVTNTGGRPLPDVAVTVTNPRYGTAAQSFGTLMAQPTSPSSQPLAGKSRPVWIINSAPGRCSYSCANGGPGGAVTAGANTWALGRLAPHQTATFRWRLTAVQAGHYKVGYQVTPSLSAGSRASGTGSSGRLVATISTRPQQLRVADDGSVVAG